MFRFAGDRRRIKNRIAAQSAVRTDAAEYCESICKNRSQNFETIKSNKSEKGIVLAHPTEAI
jgi:hypothetical protein